MWDSFSLEVIHSALKTRQIRETYAVYTPPSLPSTSPMVSPVRGACSRMSGPSWTCLSVEGCTSVEVFPLNAIKEVHDDVPKTY